MSSCVSPAASAGRLLSVGGPSGYLVHPLRTAGGRSAADGRQGSMKPEGVRRLRDNIRAKIGAQKPLRESATSEPRQAGEAGEGPSGWRQFAAVVAMR
jgi:hypothetical protein